MCARKSVHNLRKAVTPLHRYCSKRVHTCISCQIGGNLNRPHAGHTSEMPLNTWATCISCRRRVWPIYVAGRQPCPTLRICGPHPDTCTPQVIFVAQANNDMWPTVVLKVWPTASRDTLHTYSVLYSCLVVSDTGRVVGHISRAVGDTIDRRCFSHVSHSLKPSRAWPRVCGVGVKSRDVGDTLKG